jgi:hypothetical protein
LRFVTAGSREGDNLTVPESCDLRNDIRGGDESLETDSASDFRHSECPMTNPSGAD